ncbi:hypothetical protein [Micromonospora ureilytica]|nr:hypothetical protein [Micromonospora ureilytica]
MYEEVGHEAGDLFIAGQVAVDADGGTVGAGDLAEVEATAVMD